MIVLESARSNGPLSPCDVRTTAVSNQPSASLGSCVTRITVLLRTIYYTALSFELVDLSSAARARLVKEDQRPRVVPVQAHTGPLAAAEITRLVILKARKFYICKELMGALQVFETIVSPRNVKPKYVVENADPRGAEPAVGTDKRFVGSDTELMTTPG